MTDNPYSIIERNARIDLEENAYNNTAYCIQVAETMINLITEEHGGGGEPRMEISTDMVWEYNNEIYDTKVELLKSMFNYDPIEIGYHIKYKSFEDDPNWMISCEYNFDKIIEIVNDYKYIQFPDNLTEDQKLFLDKVHEFTMGNETTECLKYMRILDDSE